MINFQHTVLTDVGKLLQAGLMVVGYFIGNKIFRRAYPGPIRRALSVLAAVGVLAMLAYGTLGTHVDDSDPVYGGGETVADYEPSMQERYDAAIDVLVLLGVPMFIGAFRADKTSPVYHHQSQ